MTRCKACDYSPTTPQITKVTGEQERRRLVYDSEEDCHYCDKCSYEISNTIKDFDDYALITPEDK